MNTLIRWGKFNLVGVMGMGFQLAALSLLNHCAPGHYLLATAGAIELTLVHNFAWHLHFTWRDRRDKLGLFRQLFRFHASNGLVSMLGNLVLMRFLVQQAHAPILVANGIAILVCSLINFVLGDRWAFAGRGGFGDHYPIRGRAGSLTLAPRQAFSIGREAGPDGRLDEFPGGGQG